MTLGAHAVGVLAQSIGGGGGNGGISVALALNASVASTGPNSDISASVGGFGGAAGNASTVQVTRNGSITTLGDYAIGILAQSIGGGGGNGGLAVSGSVGGTDAKSFSASVGGFGAGGGTGGLVTVDNTGAITTSGAKAQAIFAQSVGGGGGTGGIAATGIFGITGDNTNFNLGISIGGKGGTGGTASDVNVTNNGALTTSGTASQGIFAQSIGGGGGAGGDAFVGFVGVSPSASEGKTVAVNLVIGGNGGSGGKAGNVVVDQSGSITTSGDGSHGIQAQSIGGGGGTGGDAHSISLLLGCPSKRVGCTPPPSANNDIRLQFTLGGFGGTGNDAGGVTVTNHDAITTHGQSASGIYAQSIGGGGGSGGNAVLGSKGMFPNPIPLGPETPFSVFDQSKFLKTLSIAIGGGGGAAGNGGTVLVTNDGSITVTGGNNREGDFVNCGNNTNITTCNSWGIWAQSVGGGGGAGGFGAVGTTGTVGIGGGAFHSNSSGDGGTVTVTNNASAAIQATGQLQSGGIFAQSVGGGGGAGGAGSGLIDIGGLGGSAGNGGVVTVTNHGTITSTGLELGRDHGPVDRWRRRHGWRGRLSLVSIGGDGGSSGNGGAVTVTNSGTITTNGNDANGIFAESTGGGGGRGGGNTATGTPTITSASVFQIGGKGASGGTGGTVNVTNTAAITTNGSSANGIFAHSVGGGGGHGGEAIGLIALGGSGGASGDGGAVTVTNGSVSSATAVITTNGKLANGIEAQSVGGGGGKAGAGFLATPIGTLTLGIGGTSAAGGKGGTVTVDNYATVVTHGEAATAILAQSVGGGGGNGGYAGSFGTSAVPTVSVAVGGNGGQGGDGGLVTVNNFAGANIATNAVNSTGVFAQSVGGGGGIGGASLADTPIPGSSGNVVLGGQGGVAGNGGKVNVTNAGTINIAGNNSIAVFAQSVGGGGGSAGSALGVAVVPVFIGGEGGANGKGDDVTVINTGTIVISGNNSVGIFAQSVGGGGGLVRPGGGASSVTAENGGIGDGGTVTVRNTGMIIITGDNSVGLYSQSVGGGGGAVGMAGGLTGSGGSSLFGASAAAPGDPDQVGAFMFSNTAGGAGIAGLTVVEQQDSVIMPGMNSVAVVAQSAAAGGQGDITVNILNKPNQTTLIVGGAGSGAGVKILGGAENQLNNFGIITSVQNITSPLFPAVASPVVFFGAAGTAVTGTDGNDVINNHNFMLGSVDLGTGTNGFNNLAGAIYWSGTSVNLGAAVNPFINDGVIAPGGTSNVMTTSITGSFTQSAAAVYALDLDFSLKTADRINATGTATVSGTIPINILNPGAAQTGAHKLTIVRADGGQTHSNLTLSYIPSAVTTYGLSYTATDIELNYAINYDPAGLSGNQASVGTAIDRIQSAGNLPAFVPIGAALFYIPTVEALGRAYNNLSAEGTSGTQQTAFTVSGMFTQLMMGQISNAISGSVDDVPGTLSYAYAPEHISDTFAGLKNTGVYTPMWRGWFAGFGGQQTLDGEASTGSAALRQRAGGMAFGFDYRAAPDIVVGLAAGASTSSFQVRDRATFGDAGGAHVGAYGIKTWGPLYLAGMASYSHFENNTKRTISGVGPTETAAGKFAADQLATRLELGWKHELERFTVTPFAAIQVARLWQHAYTESSVLQDTCNAGHTRRLVCVAGNPVAADIHRRADRDPHHVRERGGMGALHPRRMGP